MKKLRQYFLVGAWAAGVIMPAQAEEGSDPAQKAIMGLFSVSSAPTFYEKESELVLETSFNPWQRTSHWHPEIDEADVYHARLQHRSLEERWWELGIGKGGQLYSMYSTYGEAMAPSSPESQWNDEVWQFTTIYEHLLGRDLPENPDDHTRMNFANAFVHQSGIYTREKGMKPFYSPLLADYYDPERRAYSVVSWGQIPSPSINRSGILVYTQYRDLGAGVIEMTYLIYNFENEPMRNLGPWGGVRTSVFPEQVISNPDGSYRFFTPWSYRTSIKFEETGGWAAATPNANDPNSHALGVVFGKKLDRKGKHRGKPFYDSGNSRHGERDYSVQATVILIEDEPFTPHLLRMYFVIDTLDKVAEKANAVADFADYEPMKFTEADTPLIPLYEESRPFNVVKSASASSEFSKDYRAAKAIDGKLSAAREWSSKGEQAPWIRLNLKEATRINRVVLHDKANPDDNARGGTLRFSDGTSQKVTGIPDDGSPLTVEFPEKEVKWVKLELSEGVGNNVGLTEFKVISDAAGKQTFFSRKPAGKPVCEVYAWPVNGSVPLFLIKNNETGRYFMSTDPYAQCDQEPFVNPLKPGHESYEKYQDRTIYRPYLGKTEWVELLGFVMPKAKADTKAIEYTPLSEVRAVEHSFDAGDKLGAEDLMVRGR